MSDPTTPEPSAEASVIRSEERLRVTTRRAPARKAVLRKVIVVEQRTITIDVAHEEVRLEYVPLDEDVDATEGHAAHRALPELVLHEEQVVVSKRTVPTERIRAKIVTVTDEIQVTEDLRHEQIDVTRRYA